MEQNCVLLDTSFFIRLLNGEDPLHENAMGYFIYFLKNGFIIKISTIAIAEYCVRGEVSELPLKNLLVVPFNFDHAQRAGKMIAEVYAEKKKRGAIITPRAVVPNDTKMFAQADIEPDINFYGTADVESKKVYDLIKSAEGKLSFSFIDITIPHYTYFGELNFEE